MHLGAKSQCVLSFQSLEAAWHERRPSGPAQRAQPRSPVAEKDSKRANHPHKREKAPEGLFGDAGALGAAQRSRKGWS